jgi:hypothetical protein
MICPPQSDLSAACGLAISTSVGMLMWAIVIGLLWCWGG